MDSVQCKVQYVKYEKAWGTNNVLSILVKRKHRNIEIDA